MKLVKPVAAAGNLLSCPSCGQLVVTIEARLDLKRQLSVIEGTCPDGHPFRSERPLDGLLARSFDTSSVTE